MKIAKVVMISALALIFAGAVFFVIAARKRPHLAPENRFNSDFTLFMNNGKVWVRERKYASGDVISERRLALSEMKSGSEY